MIVNRGQMSNGTAEKLKEKKKIKKKSRKNKSIRRKHKSVEKIKKRTRMNREYFTGLLLSFICNFPVVPSNFRWLLKLFIELFDIHDNFHVLNFFLNGLRNK